MEKRFTSHSCVTISRKRGDDAAPTIEGYAAVWYDDDDDGTEFELYSESGLRVVERIMPGAFSHAIAEDDCLALFNHSPDMVLGRSSAGTLRLSEDKRGLRYEIDAPDTQLGRDLATSLARGDISGSSFSFDIEGEQFERQKMEDGTMLMVRNLKAVRLHDVGPVSMPAYGSTSAGMRSSGRGGQIKAILKRAEVYFADRSDPTLAIKLRAIAVRAQTVEWAD